MRMRHKGNFPYPYPDSKGEQQRTQALQVQRMPMRIKGKYPKHSILIQVDFQTEKEK